VWEEEAKTTIQKSPGAKAGAGLRTRNRFAIIAMQCANEQVRRNEMEEKAGGAKKWFHKSG
jgi:hypothetical protein